MVRGITIVLADWCPHCVPLSLEIVRQIANETKAQLRVLDIDKIEEMKLADRLVKEHGDFSEDYLIPQVFVEREDGNIEHIFTGFSEGVHITKARWDDFLSSKYYRTGLRGSMGH